MSHERRKEIREKSKEKREKRKERGEDTSTTTSAPAIEAKIFGASEE